jgi:hypothetical protein
MQAATILALWHLLSPGLERLPTAAPIAAAIATACAEDAARGYADAPLEAAVMAVYAYRESSLRPAVTGDGGRSCGMLQMRCELVRGLDLTGQARLWLSLVHRSSLGDVDSSPARARRRTRLAARLLDGVSGRGVAERPQ